MAHPLTEETQREPDTWKAKQSLSHLEERPSSYLDGYETQEAAGFRKQGSEVVRVDNQHLCGKDLLH